MTSLPERYGVKDDTPKVVTNNFLVSIGIVVGACGVAVMGSSIVVKTGEFYYFAAYALTMLQQTQFVSYVGYAALVLGFLGILTGFLLALAGLFVHTWPKLTVLSLVLTLCVGVGDIVAGSLIAQGVSFLDGAIYNQSPTPAPSSGSAFTATFTQNATHFQIAMFNACCASHGLNYSRETYPGINNVPESVDMDGYVKWCGGLYSTDYQDIESANSPRSCFKDQETYREFNYSVQLNAPRICYALDTANVNIVGKKVPGTDIDVSGFTHGQDIVPIAGPYSAPTYGCGIGYAKAFQAAMLIWAENLLSPVSTAFLACGSIYIFLFVVGLAANYSCSRSTESAEERYVRYLEELNNTSSAAASNKQVADAVIVTESFEHANPTNRFSVNSNRASLNQPMAPINPSNRMSMQSYNTQGSQSSGHNNKQADFDFNVDDKI